MTSENGSTMGAPTVPDTTKPEEAVKDKGKAAEEPVVDMSMDEGEEDEEEEEDENDEAEVEEAEEEDNLEEIDPSNIVEGGRRTRGLVIDFAKADKETPRNKEDGFGEDEEEDDEYTAPGEKDNKDQDKMDED